MDSDFPPPPGPAGFHISRSLGKAEGHAVILSTHADPGCQRARPQEVARAGHAAHPGPPFPVRSRVDKAALGVLKPDLPPRRQQD